MGPLPIFKRIPMHWYMYYLDIEWISYEFFWSLKYSFFKNLSRQY